MKKKLLSFDARALNILKTCLFIVMLGVMISIIIITSYPSHRMAENCRQMLFGCAFAFDIAVGGTLWIDSLFKGNKK